MPQGIRISPDGNLNKNRRPVPVVSNSSPDLIDRHKGRTIVFNETNKTFKTYSQFLWIIVRINSLTDYSNYVFRTD